MIIRGIHSTNFFHSAGFLLSAIFLFSHFIFSQSSTDSLTFSFQNSALKTVIDSLIHEHRIPVVYQDRYLTDLQTSVDCTNCTVEEALDKLLFPHALKWEKIDNQYIILLPKSEKEILTI